MSNLDRRGGYTPRRVREKRAYQLLMTGAGTGGLGLVVLVVSIVGIVSLAWLGVILLIVAAICAYGFMRVTGQR